MRPQVNSQHILHRRYEGAIRFGRNDPALLAVGLDNVFFSTRPIVLSLARSTILSSTTFSSNSRKLQRAKPSGGWEHARAISLASFSPSKIRATGGLSRTLRLSTASNPQPLLNQLLSHAVNHRLGRIQGPDDLAVAPTLTRVRDVPLQQNQRLHHPPRRDLSLGPQRLEQLALLSAESNDVPLYRNFPPRHPRLRP